MGKTIAVSNMKGGVGKTMTAASLGAGLARQGKTVLCLDADAQHSLTISLGISEPSKLPVTLTTMMSNIINDTDFDPTAGIVHHPDGVDLLPSNNTLAGLEIALAGMIGRETVLRQYIENVKPLYDYTIIDCAPSLDLLTINSLAAADSIIIPVVPRFLDAKVLGSQGEVLPPHQNTGSRTICGTNGLKASIPKGAYHERTDLLRLRRLSPAESTPVRPA